jgi:hypothetical protein
MDRSILLRRLHRQDSDNDLIALAPLDRLPEYGRPDEAESAPARASYARREGSALLVIRSRQARLRPAGRN